MRKLTQFFLVCLLLLPGYSGRATGDSLLFLTAKDTVFLSVNAFGEKIFEHNLAPKQTLYSLARFYGLNMAELYYYNPGLEGRATKVGDPIRVPIPNRAIKRFLNETTEDGAYVPVYYVVRKGDTMYRISKYYFKMPADTIRHRNNLFSDELKTGQLLHVGWMNTKGVPEAYREGSGGPLSQRNQALKRVYMAQRQGRRETEQQGVAFWQKDSREDSDLYALHRNAEVGSIIEITNPMKNRTVYAKVIGRIPDTAYGNNVVVILSPLAAKLLGARDPRFFVRLHYLY